MNLLIVIGVEKYKNLKNIPACFNDARAIKEVICNVKNLEQDEILYLNSNEPALTIKREIVSFIKKHQGKTVEDLIFYFSGHGSRDQSDFYFLPNDYDASKSSSTSFKNSELDDLVRNISPKNYIKIIDACHSGTSYIKSNFDWQSSFSKSAEKLKLKLKNIYFWFSSGEKEYSEAGKDFSYFTEAILTSILEIDLGEVRYIDISEKVADELKKYDQTPLFIEQAGKTELFGTIKKETHSIIEKLYGLDIDKSKDTHTQEKKPTKEYSLTEKIKNKETEIFTNKDIFNFSTSLRKFLSEKNNWNQEIINLFDLTFDTIERASHIPNNKFIATWASNKISHEFYINFIYRTEVYEEKEYVKTPKKPSTVVTPNGRNSVAAYAGQLQSLSTILGIPRDSGDYTLENVKKTKNIIDGFEYYKPTGEETNEITLTPKSPILNKIKIYTVLLYSHKKIVIFYSHEELRKLYWDTFSSPNCSTWNKIVIDRKSNSFIEDITGEVVQKISTWIVDKINSKLNP